MKAVTPRLAMASFEWNFCFVLVVAEREKRIKPFSNAVLTACWKKAYGQFNRAILFLHPKKREKNYPQFGTKQL